VKLFCDRCEPYGILLKDEDYGNVVAEMIEKLTSLTPQNNFVITNIANITAKLFIDATIINPEKITYYACLVASYYDTIVRFAYDDNKECVIDDEYATLLMKHDFTVKDIRIWGSGLMTCVTASLELQDGTTPSNFYLTEEGVRGQFAYAVGNDEAGEFCIAVEHITTTEKNTVVPQFVLLENVPISLERKQELFDKGIQIYNLHLADEGRRGGRCKSISHKSFDQDMPFFDKKWNAVYAKRQQQKQQQLEKTQKEQERKEKKEREREEQRKLAIKRREEENALRLARASLIEAVAKVDEELEKIKRLKELNREVALKNQKLAEQKEAERIAKDAEKRHAEKMKQKEIERQQKFASKKH